MQVSSQLTFSKLRFKLEIWKQEKGQVPENNFFGNLKEQFIPLCIQPLVEMIC